MNKGYRFKKEFLILGLSFFLLLSNFPAQGQEKEELPLPVIQYKLKNGLQVIISEDYSLPLVSVVVAYNVGSINEEPGKTGLAYMLKNLMFQGSKNVSPMQHVSFIHRIGGDLNATTTEDKTIFQQTVPSHQLCLVLWLESDRMKSLDINAANVERAKEALIEEIRHRKANEPYLNSFLAFDELLYPDFAYSHPVIGNEADMRDLTVEDVKHFYSTFYTPNNAVLTIVGNIDKRKTEENVRKYFETIRKGKDVPLPLLPKPSERIGVVKTLRKSLAPSPGFHLGYRIPSPFSKDFYPLKIIEYILLGGKTSRLYKRLIKKERIASNLSGGIEKRKNLATLKIFVTNRSLTMVERSKKAIFSEINKLKSSLISEKELRKSKNMFKMDYINQYSTPVDKALFLAETFLSKKNLDGLSDELEKYLAVDHYRIIRITRRYFTKEIILNVRIK